MKDTEEKKNFDRWHSCLQLSNNLQVGYVLALKGETLYAFKW